MIFVLSFSQLVAASCWNHFICVICRHVVWNACMKEDFAYKHQIACIQAIYKAAWWSYTSEGRDGLVDILRIEWIARHLHFHDATEGDPCECEIYHICLFEFRNNPSCADSASRRKRPLNVCVCVCGVSACVSLFEQAFLRILASQKGKYVCAWVRVCSNWLECALYYLEKCVSLCVCVCCSIAKR